MNRPEHPALSPWRERLHEIIFEANTIGGIVFDVSLLIAILSSVIVIALETVPIDTVDQAVSVSQDQPNDQQQVNGGAEDLPAPRAAKRFGELPVVKTIRWIYTILFTIEYLLRVICVRRPLRYIFSFWGIIDLLAFLPEYFLLWRADDVVGASSFSVLRSLRLLRVFRVFKLNWIQYEAEDLGDAIFRARAKILVFVTVVLIIVTVAGTLMYEVERTSDESQFDSIPQGIYWAIVTMTTVGFGDIVPVTVPGKFVSALLILLGYSLIIVPTGFVSAEIIESRRKPVTTIGCPSCVTEGHDVDAVYCKYCGEEL